MPEPAKQMFPVRFPQIGYAAFHHTHEIFYPVVRGRCSLLRFFPDEAGDRKADDLRAAAAVAPR